VTVYRTLEQLEVLGLIQRVHQPDGCHTIMRKQSGHEHLLICTSCGKAVTFHGDNFDDLSHEVAADTGFPFRITCCSSLVYARTVRTRDKGIICKVMEETQSSC